MRSKFKYLAYFVAFLTIVFSVLLALALLSPLLGVTVPIAFYIIYNLFFILVWLWLVAGELRTKAISLTMGYDHLIVKGYLGLGPSKTIYFTEIDGYLTAILPASNTSYEYLYLMAGNKKIVKLSQFYHNNYDELKANISAANIKYLGYEDFSYKRELKEIFI